MLLCCTVFFTIRVGRWTRFHFDLPSPHRFSKNTNSLETSIFFLTALPIWSFSGYSWDLEPLILLGEMFFSWQPVRMVIWFLKCTNRVEFSFFELLPFVVLIYIFAPRWFIFLLLVMSFSFVSSNISFRTFLSAGSASWCISATINGIKPFIARCDPY